MIDITTIPFNDIIKYLQINNQIIPSNQSDAYQLVSELIQSRESIIYPLSVTDFIIAQNLQNVKLPVYKISAIIVASNDDLKDLSRALTLPYPDRERIIRILNYLGYLDNNISIFTTLSLDILENILSRVSCKTLLLICKLSPTFCTTSMDTLLRINLAKFNTSGFNRQQLINSCTISSAYTNISAGFHHSLILTDNQQVYSFGINFAYQLGLGDNYNRISPTLINNLRNVISISAGINHSLVSTNLGKVYSFGSNDSGQLGLGDMQVTKIPKIIPSLYDIVLVSAGGTHSLALNIDGNVYGFGDNVYYQLGVRDNTNKYIPIHIPGLNNVIAVSAGTIHSMALVFSGQVYVFGNNRLGQLGLSDRNTRQIPALIPNLPDIVAISSRYFHSLILSNTGQVYAFGANEDGQLGLGCIINTDIPTLIDINNIMSISAGRYHSLILSNDKQVYACGDNITGQLGLASCNYCGTNDFTVIPKINDIEQISAGGFSSFILMNKLNKKRVYSFGYNRNGELGLGDNEIRNDPALVMAIN